MRNIQTICNICGLISNVAGTIKDLACSETVDETLMEVYEDLLLDNVSQLQILTLEITKAVTNEEVIEETVEESPVEETEPSTQDESDYQGKGDSAFAEGELNSTVSPTEKDKEEK